MNRLLIARVCPGLSVPDFGAAFAYHISTKKLPRVRDESLTAWKLLALALKRDRLPEVFFTENGQPYFPSETLYFSISHSGCFACAMLSDMPCGADVEQIRPERAEKLRSRCLLPSEADMDFYHAWTLKESIGKMTGEGIRPLMIDTAAQTGLNTFTDVLPGDDGIMYRLSAVSRDPGTISARIVEL